MNAGLKMLDLSWPHGRTMKNIKVIGFDADDTLWSNENYYKAAENEFYALMADIMPPEKTAGELFRTEMENLELYGFGAKGFILSTLETALRISGDTVPAPVMRRVLESGKRLLDFPIEPLPGVVPVLTELKPLYRLVLITKGDLLDQERKLAKSGLEGYFHHIEILSKKEKKDYEDLLETLGVEPRDFLMVGNSLKSDIIPVLELGGCGVHIPFSVTWQHEVADAGRQDPERFRAITSIKELPALL